MTHSTTCKVEVFDPSLCCPSGVCGPRVDPALLRASSDLKWLTMQGVAVMRYNLAQQPQAFAGNEAVNAALVADPGNALPLVLIDGKIVSRGAYPSRHQLADWLGLTVTTAAVPATTSCCDSSDGC